MITRIAVLLAFLFSFVWIIVPASAWQQFFTANRFIDDYDQVCAPSVPNRIVYCGGPLIEAVNYYALYNDSKDFVDSPMRVSPVEVMLAFNRTFPSDIRKIDPKALRVFVDNYFERPTTELVECEPADWTAEPPEIMKIQDETLRKWALQLNGLWKTLCRRIDPLVAANLDKHSILHVPNNFIIPGGRFREPYYWDSFWIIKGLLVSGMVDTAKGMARNLASLVDRYGFVPNGGRVYYTKRSQPPLLIPSVYVIYEQTDDLDFVKELMPSLEREFQFWQTERKHPIQLPNNETREVFFYRPYTFTPRPESMRVDLNHSDGMDERTRRAFFQSAAGAAESGWDFSSRWFADHKTIQTVETANIAPVDLNSFVCWNMQILQYFAEVQGDLKKSRMYEQMHTEFRYILNEVFYNNDYGSWFDYNSRTREHIVHTYPSVATPLFTGCYDQLDTDKPRRLFHAFLHTGFFNFSGGVPTSLVQNTDQQWDFPNGHVHPWAPLNHMIIEGLRKSANPAMQDKAFEVAVKWISGNWKVFNSTRLMFEKYNVIGKVPEPGGGGEYGVVTGFGWSNGVILDLLSTYYDRIRAAPMDEDNSDTNAL